MVYAGLTVSGYELASLREEDPMVAVAARAASIPWPKDLIASGPVWFCTKNDPGRAHPFGSQPLQFSFKTARNAPPREIANQTTRDQYRQSAIDGRFSIANSASSPSTL